MRLERAIGESTLFKMATATGTKRSRDASSDDDSTDPPMKRQKLNEIASKDTKFGNDTSVSAFKKSLSNILKKGPFICNSEIACDWEIKDLSPSKVYKSMENTLKAAIDTIVDHNVDNLAKSILSFVYVSDRILSCIEDQEEELFNKNDNYDDKTFYDCYDKLYHIIIDGGLDSNDDYTKYDELSFAFNNYQEPKELISELSLYGIHVDFCGTSDEDDDIDDEEKNEIRQKRKTLHAQCDAIKNLINEYKKKGILKKYSPYSIKVPDGSGYGDGANEICEFLEDENNLKDEEILNGYIENGTNDNWNDGGCLGFFVHYLVFEFNDNCKVALNAFVTAS